MLRLIKNKEFIGMVKSGLVGAFAFTGISFILSIASGFMHWWISWFVYVFALSIPFPKTVFTVMGSIGFILGLMLRQRYPVIQRGVLPLVIALVMLVVSLGWRGLLVHKMWMGTELPPLSLKLADCTNNVVNIHLKIPKGHYYRIVLALPSGSTNVFSGRINISDEISTITNLFIGSSQIEQQCNFLHAQSNYDLEITFDQLPPPLTSIELHWLQTQRDKAK